VWVGMSFLVRYQNVFVCELTTVPAEVKPFMAYLPPQARKRWISVCFVSSTEESSAMMRLCERELKLICFMDSEPLEL